MISSQSHIPCMFGNIKFNMFLKINVQFVIVSRDIEYKILVSIELFFLNMVPFIPSMILLTVFKPGCFKICIINTKLYN